MYSETITLPPELMEAAKKAALAKQKKAKAAAAKKPAAKVKTKKR